MTFKTIKHTDVHGKTLMYVQLEHNNNKILINIGQKNYDLINDLLKSKKQTTLNV